VHPLWFYKHQHDNRVRSKLFVACQRWWFQWLFWFVPSVPGYLREEEEHKHDPWRNPIERNHMGLHLENEVAVVKTPTIISNNIYIYIYIYKLFLLMCKITHSNYIIFIHFLYVTPLWEPKISHSLTRCSPKIRVYLARPPQPQFCTKPFRKTNAV